MYIIHICMFLIYHYPFKHDPNLYVAGDFPILDIGWNTEDPISTFSDTELPCYENWTTPDSQLFPGLQMVC